MREIVASADLEVGMFVSELDRPWSESPFMLQGFLIEDDETLRQLRECCRFVSVDRTRSVGDAFRARDRENIASQVGASLRGKAKSRPVAEEESDQEALPGFLDILRMIRSGKLDELPPAGEVKRGGVAARGDESPLRELRSVERELIQVAPVFRETEVALDKVLSDVRRNADPDLGKLREGVEDMVRSVARNPDALLWLTRLKATDEYSYQHALDTSVHMIIFARSLGMGDGASQLLGMAGMLLDVGKLRMPPRLLSKNARLSPLEYEIFKTHVDYSVSILEKLPHATPPLVEIVARHHERANGSGYPRGLAGEHIGLHAEIAGLVDSYTAMTGKREYSDSSSTHGALEELIRLRGKTFRAELVDQFVQCIGIYPVGSLVELNSGEVAVVIGQNRVRRLKPRVMVLLAPDKSANAYPPLLDLLYDPSAPTGEPYAIARALPVNAYGIDPQEFYLS